MAIQLDPAAFSTKRAEGEIPEPPLGVYILTEFAFCPRAGLCAYETKGNEPDDSPPLSFFSYDPLYRLSDIEIAIEQAYREMIPLAIAAFISAVVGLMLSIFVNDILGFAVGTIGVLWFGVYIVQKCVRVFRLLRQRKEALTAREREPDPNAPEIQTVHWWDFLRAGFKTEERHVELIDHELNFSGVPTRYLVRDDDNLVIPVWRMRHYKGQYYRQNVIRMAAYCHLVLQSMGGEKKCPYGVILFGHGFEGIAIPFTPERREEFLRVLEEARMIINRSRNRPQDAGAPANANLCKKCVYGKPEHFKLNESEHICNGKSLGPVLAKTPDEDYFHSLCGDRFDWLPPHEDVERKELTL
jgi:CRISPR/Cas system-associated exonuclease Cas4 (RecB family)